MNNRLLHTPEGVRDIYGKEYAKKLAVEQKLQQAIHCFGYEDIQTPSIEFFDVFSKEIGTTPSKELYKFFDKEGKYVGAAAGLYAVHRPLRSEVFYGGKGAASFQLQRQYVYKHFQSAG